MKVRGRPQQRERQFGRRSSALLADKALHMHSSVTALCSSMLFTGHGANSMSVLTVRAGLERGTLRKAQGGGALHHRSLEAEVRGSSRRRCATTARLWRARRQRSGNGAAAATAARRARDPRRARAVTLAVDASVAVCWYLPQPLSGAGDRDPPGGGAAGGTGLLQLELRAFLCAPSAGRAGRRAKGAGHRGALPCAVGPFALLAAGRERACNTRNGGSVHDNGDGYRVLGLRAGLVTAHPQAATFSGRGRSAAPARRLTCSTRMRRRPAQLRVLHRGQAIVRIG